MRGLLALISCPANRFDKYVEIELQGSRAFLDGQRITHCPWKVGSRESESWKMGFFNKSQDNGIYVPWARIGRPTQNIVKGMWRKPETK